MRNAAGSIFEDKRRKGVHRLCLELPPDPTGKRNRQTFTVRGSRRQAELRLAELLHQRERGGLAHSPKVTLSEYLEDWLAGMEGQVRSRTLEGYRTIVERHLIPKLGGIRLAKLQAEDIRAYYRDREAQGRQDGRPKPSHSRR